MAAERNTRRWQSQYFTDIGRARSCIVVLDPVEGDPDDVVVGRGESLHSQSEANGRALGELVERQVFLRGADFYKGVHGVCRDIFVPGWEHPYLDKDALLNLSYDDCGYYPVRDGFAGFVGFCPLSLVFPFKSVGTNLFLSSNGWSCGHGRVEPSLFELIERDFILRWWYGESTVDWDVSEKSQPHLRHESTKLLVLKKKLFLAGSDVDLFVSLVARISDQYPYMVVGSAVRESESAASEKAYLETVALMKFSSDWLLCGQRSFNEDSLINNPIRSFCYPDARDHLLNRLSGGKCDDFDAYDFNKFRYMSFNSPLNFAVDFQVLRGFYVGAMPLLSLVRERAAGLFPHHPLP